ncbi:MAG: hypothetical protein GAK28_00808 [Luteibacter sp.]|uniref:hypothetical protein n=1 Tax=Luteibacter sp. TaxID=1886636 RepID=UPI0013844D06|nr:hypothetical protein [Luteibacter sp.]KAF1009175.1 MAG: hypothetical protein GAK28_00808 [Luteibacter sp.]
MSEPKDDSVLGEGSFALDTEASVDVLMNDATSMQAYAEAMQALLTEYMCENEVPNRRYLTRAMAGVNLLHRMSLQCTKQANARRMWDAVRSMGGG